MTIILATLPFMLAYILYQTSFTYVAFATHCPGTRHFPNITSMEYARTAAHCEGLETHPRRRYEGVDSPVTMEGCRSSASWWKNLMSVTRFCFDGRFETANASENGNAEVGDSKRVVTFFAARRRRFLPDLGGLIKHETLDEGNARYSRRRPTAPGRVKHLGC